jgi:hypothetical protein
MNWSILRKHLTRNCDFYLSIVLGENIAVVELVTPKKNFCVVELVTPSHLVNKIAGYIEGLNEIDPKKYSPGEPKSPGESGSLQCSQTLQQIASSLIP